MEIIVVDDHSTKDDPGQVVSRLAGDRVRFIRQPQNVGKARNYETGIAASRGKLIHQLHGDDLVKPGFYDSTEKAFELCPEVGAVFCESEYIDSNGNVTGRTGREREATGLIDNWPQRIITAQRIQTPSIVVRREVYEKLGAFDRRLTHAEDWEMWIRIALHFSVGFNAEGMAQYRCYTENTSSLGILSGTQLSTFRQLLRIVDGYIPSDLRNECACARAEALAHFFIRWLPVAVKNRSPTCWLKLCREILQYKCSPRVLYYMLVFTLR